MIRVETSQAPSQPSFQASLADLSRNASVISSSSSSDSTSSLILNTPRPRPVRTFSSPRAKSPQATTSRNTSRPPSYLTGGGLGHRDDHLNGAPAADSRRGAGTRSQSRNRSVNGRLSAQDFVFGEELGEGSYSTVKRATHIVTGQEYAIKILDKGHLRRYNKMETALAEKNTLVRLGSGHPGIVRLHSTFQDEWSLFFVLDLAKNGEMQSRITCLGSLSTECTRNYGAQIIDALDYMHSKGVIHRDLKPENLLLDDAFRIKITDFGTGKLLGPGVETAKTFVGTSQYVSPELLEANETSKSSDLWALGCIIYQMIAGRFTFTGLSEYLTWQKIKQLDYSFPEGFDLEAKDLVQRLIVRDPAERLGAGPPGSDISMQALRNHSFFSSINWKTLWTEPAPPLESGILRREHPLPGQDQNWDVGAAWDAITDSEEDEEVHSDEIGWANDAEKPLYMIRNGYRNGQANSHPYSEEVGPLGDVPRFVEVAGREERHMDEDAETVMGHESPESGTAVGEPESMDVPGVPADNRSTTSSSDGSPIEKLGAALDALKMDRGRNRVQTPVQGNGHLLEVDLSSLLLSDEKIMFTSRVEARAIRRRASRLILISVSPLKPKVRQLILTSHRIVSVKQRERGILSKKCELFFRPSSTSVNGISGKEKDSRIFIVGVEAKTDREFVVLTSGKSQTYAASDSSIASTWVDKIRSALESNRQPVRT